MKQFRIVLKVNDKYNRFDPKEILSQLGACLEGSDLELAYGTSELIKDVNEPMIQGELIQ